MTAEEKRLVLRVQDAGMRVDRYVAEHSQLSRSAITRLAKAGHVRIGGAPVDAGHRVRKGDETLRAQLEQILEKKQVEIRKILIDYGVPLLDQKAGSK